MNCEWTANEPRESKRENLGNDSGKEEIVRSPSVSSSSLASGDAFWRRSEGVVEANGVRRVRPAVILGEESADPADLEHECDRVMNDE